VAYVEANLLNEQIANTIGFNRSHSNVCGECLLRSNPDRIPTRTVGIEDSMEICSQDKCILGSESQVLLDRGFLVDVISKMGLQLSSRLIQSDARTYTRPCVGSGIASQLKYW
jgi:hypothetical protein